MKKLLRLGSALVAALFVFTISVPAVSAQVVVNEFMAENVEIVDTNGQWVELANTGDTAVAVNGWSINGALITASAEVEPGQAFVVCTDTNPATNGGVTCDAQADLTLNPAGGTLTLTDDSTVTVDTLDYTDEDVNPSQSTEVTQTATTPVLTPTEISTPGAQNTHTTNTVLNQNTGIIYASIQSAADAALAGHTLVAASGTYNENVNLAQDVTLEGQAGATINGSVTVDSDGVTVTGMTITNTNASFGVIINGRSNISVTNNTIHHIGSALATGSAQAIYLGAGSGAVITNVDLSDNDISNIGSTNLAYSGVPGSGTSAKGIYVGDTAGTGTITGLTISGNSITDIYASTAAWNTGRGAYGILINFGGTTAANISNNTITSLEGLWSHGIGLERNTPGTTLSNNTVTDLTDHKGGIDAHAIFFESNASAASVTFNGQTISSTDEVAVNAAWTGYQNNPVVSLNDRQYIFGVNAFTTIAAGIAAVGTNGTVNVAAGTYAETLTIGKALTLDGAGDSQVTGTNIALAGAGSLVTVTSSNVTLSDLRMDRLSSVGSVLDIAGASISNITLDGITATGAIGNGSSPANGLRVGTSSQIDGLVVTDSHFDGNDIGWYLAKESANSTDVTNVTVTNTSFSNNNWKGIYAEKLSHASFTDITIANSGTSSTYGFNAGIDINLKWSAYSDIAITDSTVSGSGLMGSASNILFPAAITIKARDDNSYSSSPATLNNVTLTNVVISGGVNGLRFGEPARNNAGPTNVSIVESSISGFSNKALVNETPADITATLNWWGTDTQANITSAISGLTLAQYTPWYINPGRTLLNTAITGDSVSVDDGDLDLPAETPGQAQLPTNVEVLTFSNDTVLNLNQNTQTATVTVVGSTPTVTVGGTQVNQTQTIANTSVELEKQVTLQSGTGNAVKIKSNAPAVTNVTVEIPNNTTVYGSNTWDGTIKPPAPVTVAPGQTAPSGFSFGSTVLTVGSATETIVFSQYVTILLEDVTGPIAYQPAGSTEWFTVAECAGTFANPTDPGFPGECYISENGDTKILTYHFTSFAALTANSSPAPTGSSQQSSSSSPIATPAVSRRPVNTDTAIAAAPQVAAEQAGTSSDLTPAEEDTTITASTSTGIASDGLKWWHWALIGVTVTGMLYYLAGDQIRKKLSN